MKPKKSPSIPFGLAFLAIVAATAGTLTYQNRRAHGTHIATTGTDTGTTTSPSASPGTILPDPLPRVVDEKSFGPAIYRIVGDDNGSHLSKITAPKGTAPTVEGALNAMAAEKDSPLPQGTHVLSCTESTDNTLATVDFNAAFVKNFGGGDTAEALALESILATVGQFGPHKVQITVEGKKIDSLGGTQSLTEPLPVPQAVVTTAASDQAPASGGDAKP